MPTAEIVRWEQQQIPPIPQKWPDRVDDHAPLAAAIKQAEELLVLADDWDGEGSVAYSKDTLDRAIAFLTVHSDFLRERYGLSLPVPRIGPGPSGSIDIHW